MQIRVVDQKERGHKTDCFVIGVFEDAKNKTGNVVLATPTQKRALEKMFTERTFKARWGDAILLSGIAIGGSTATLAVGLGPSARYTPERLRIASSSRSARAATRTRRSRSST